MQRIIQVTLLIFAICLASCANTPEAKLKQAYKRASKTNFHQLPALYVQLEREGKITPETRDAWIKGWGDDNRQMQANLAARRKEQERLAQQRRRWWASLTPAQRLDLEMRERELQQQQAAMAFQAEQQRQANVQAAWQNVSNSIQRQQELNAYNARTNTLGQPVNVNLNGNINHNINGTIYHRYPR